MKYLVDQASGRYSVKVLVNHWLSIVRLPTFDRVVSDNKVSLVSIFKTFLIRLLC